MAALKGCHCNHCRSRHKPPAPIPGYQGRRNSSRHNSCSKIYTGDEHWTKVLQASEGGQGQGPSNRQRQPSICDRCHQLHHVTRFSKHCSLSSSSTSAFRNPTGTNKRMKNVFQSLYSRFCDWFGSSCQGFGSSLLSRFTSCSQSPFNDNSFPEQTRGGEGVREELLVKVVNLDDVSALLSKNSKRETRMLCNYTSQSSEESEFGSVWTSCSSSSSLTAASNSTVSSSEGCVTLRCSRHLPVCSESTCLKRGQTTGLEDTTNSPKEQRSRFQRPQTTTTTAYHLSTFKINGGHLKSSSLSLPEKETRPDRFYRTWPLSNEEDSGRKDTVTVTSCSLIPLQDLNTGPVTEEILHETSIEWSIPYTDLTFDQIIRCGARHQIFRGRWHGDVLIHTYCDLGEREVTVFLKQVSELSRIRHENICLFMGACIHLPNLAVITSDLKGPSLYEKIHLLPDKMSMRSRVSIARQVSVAMGYLHAKGVLACKLNSRNIHLEPKVKLSLLDHGMTEVVHQRSNCACLPRGNISYTAPEMLSTLVVMRSRLHCTFSSTPETDVFAFGTLLYELFTEQFPFSGSSVETLIWRVCKGRPPSLAHLNCNSALKVLIERCWSHQPSIRPSFSEINQELQQKTGLHKCHSSSQPERLNQNMFQAAGRPHPLPHPLYRMTRQQ